MYDISAGLLSVAGLDEPIRLPPQEAAIAYLLVQALPKTVRHEAIYHGIWLDPDGEPEDARASVYVLMSKLRHRLVGSEFRIETVAGGYRLVRMNPVLPVSVIVSTILEAAHA